MERSESRRPAKPGASEAVRATIVGTGLIGASIGIALRSRGWRVTGIDEAPGTPSGRCPSAPSTPKGSTTTPSGVRGHPRACLGAVVRDILGRPGRRPDAIVTDVRSVKGPLVARWTIPSSWAAIPSPASNESGWTGQRGAARRSDLGAHPYRLHRPDRLHPAPKPARLAGRRRGGPAAPYTTRWWRWCPTCPISPLPP